jgi:hypothetical protein
MLDISWLLGWLESQGSVVTGLASAVIYAALANFAWGGMAWTVRRVKGQMAARAETNRAKAAATEEDFLRGDSELGTVDHGVNTSVTVQGILDVAAQATPALSRIFQNLFRDTPAKLPQKGHPDHVSQKQSALRAAAREIHSDVIELERVAQAAVPLGQQFVESYRAILRVPIKTDADRESLASIRDIYGGGVAASFGQFSELVRDRKGDLARFQGNEKDLTRMVRRAVKALDQIESTTALVTRFCTGELVKTANRLLNQQDGA